MNCCASFPEDSVTSFALKAGIRAAGRLIEVQRVVTVVIGSAVRGPALSSRSAKRFRQIVPARTSRCSIVRGSVEDTLDALLEAEADRLVGAARYERTEARRDTRAGSYERKLQRTTGEVKLKVPQH